MFKDDICKPGYFCHTCSNLVPIRSMAAGVRIGIAERGAFDPPAMAVPLCCQIIRCLLSFGCLHNHMIYLSFCPFSGCCKCSKHVSFLSISIHSFSFQFTHYLWHSATIHRGIFRETKEGRSGLRSFVSFLKLISFRPSKVTNICKALLVG